MYCTGRANAHAGQRAGGLHRAMKIVLLSWYFPPANDVAALRVGKLAEYLRAAGHDLWIITGKREHTDLSLSTSISPDRIIRTPWFDVNRMRFFRDRAGKTSSSKPRAVTAPAPSRAGITAALSNFYTNFVQIPDRHVGWIPFAVRAGKELMSRTKIDLVYASGPPFATFVVARKLANRFGIPWVAEYRDGWSRYVYAPKPAWRQWLDEHIEDRVTAAASGIVTVSAPWVDYYERRFHHPAIAIPNGFDPEILNGAEGPSRAPGASGIEPLTVVHMGGLYGDLRDPTALYDAIKQSGLSPAELQICFYGTLDEQVMPLAHRCGVPEFVASKPRVPFSQSIAIQRHSDVLLLLQSPLEPRNVPAKLFEYLAARRPILGIGLDEGIPARLIREREAGFYMSEAGAIAQRLKEWATQKRMNGCIPCLPESVHRGLSRAEQFQHLEAFLCSLIERKSQ